MQRRFSPPALKLKVKPIPGYCAIRALWIPDRQNAFTQIHWFTSWSLMFTLFALNDSTSLQFLPPPPQAGTEQTAPANANAFMPDHFLPSGWHVAAERVEQIFKWYWLLVDICARYYFLITLGQCFPFNDASHLESTLNICFLFLVASSGSYWQKWSWSCLIPKNPSLS